MKKKKILSIGHSYVVAANRSIMRKVAHGDDFSIELAAPNFLHGSLRTLHLEQEDTDLFTIHPIKAYFSKWVHLMYYQNLDSIIVKGKYDLVHIWEEPYVLAGYQIAKRCVETQTPYFFRTAQSLNKKYPFPFSYFERFVVKHAKAWNAGASLVYQNLLERNYPKSTGVTISLGTDKNIFYPSKIDREAIRDDLKLEGFVIGFSGRLVSVKGLDVLMAALEIVAKTSTQKWSLLALGSGPYKEKIEQWAKALNFEERVKVRLVAHDEMPKYMRAMDCLVAPSQTAKNWKEQFGRMITEAFATEVPVIGSTSGEIPFVIGEAGIVADEKKPLEWAEALIRLMEDPDLCEYYKKSGMQRFLSRYEVSEIAKKYCELYNLILGPSSERIS